MSSSNVRGGMDVSEANAAQMRKTICSTTNHTNMKPQSSSYVTDYIDEERWKTYGKNTFVK